MCNKYEFGIKFRVVSGSMSVAAPNDDEAVVKITDIVGERLANAFPELDVEYDVELEDVFEGGDPDEAYAIAQDQFSN